MSSRLALSILALILVFSLAAIPWAPPQPAHASGTAYSSDTGSPGYPAVERPEIPLFSKTREVLAAISGAAADLGAGGYAPGAGSIIYVDDDAAGANDGSSWADAYTDLQDALDDAVAGDDIWVAAGTYRPSVEHGGSGGQYRSFQMKNGVAIYGGFAGFESPGSFDLGDRDFSANETILSGDLNADGVRDTSDAYHVFYHDFYIYLNASAILDGFTITDGYASGNGALYDWAFWSYEHSYAGGGMYNDTASPTIRNCTFSDNTTGAGPYSFTGRCNTGPGGFGGAIYNRYSSPAIANCTFISNAAGSGITSTGSRSCPGNGGDGGAIYNYYSSPVIRGCMFTANRAGNGGRANTQGGKGGNGGGGGAIYNRKSSPEITVCVFSDNHAGNGATGAWGGTGGHGGAIYNSVSSPKIKGSIFSQNYAGNGGRGYPSYGIGGNGGAIYNYATYNPDPSSPIIVNCVFDGNRAGTSQVDGSGGGIYSTRSRPTVINCTFHGNTARRGGAVFSWSSTNTNKIANSILWGNTGTESDNEIGAGYCTVTVIYSDIWGGHAGTGNIAADPQFGDATAGDFHLQAGSPCIDQGSSAQIPAWVDTDFEGDYRFYGTAADMGADEALVGFAAMTRPATETGETTVVLNAEIDNLGAGESLEVSFEWGPDPEPPYGNETTARTVTSDGPFAETVARITPETTYYYRVKAVGSAYASYGRQMSFTTLIAKDIFYVKQSATGANDGSSWEDAFTDLQDALNAAGLTDEIWVAEGIYMPTQQHGGSGDRYRSFQMKNEVSICGGFPASGSPGWADREPGTYPTILSGDIGVADNPLDNCYHVFYHPQSLSLNETAVLDGFTITGGAADGSGIHDEGGGMYNQWAAPTVVNCKFLKLGATLGGAICNVYSSPRVIDCVFEQNVAMSSGGAIYSGGSLGQASEIEGCTFTANVAQRGGAMYNDEGSWVQIEDSVFMGNRATWHNAPEVAGGAMDNEPSSSVAVTGCLFQENTAISDVSYHNFGGAILNINCSPLFQDCRFDNNGGDWCWGGAISNRADPRYAPWADDPGVCSPTLMGCTFKENIGLQGGAICNEALRNEPDTDDGGVCSPELIDCFFIDNEAREPEGADPDLLVGCGGAISNYAATRAVCDPSVANCVFSGNTAHVNGGGMESYARVDADPDDKNDDGQCTPNVVNCTFHGNHAGEAGGGISSEWSTGQVTNCILWGDTSGSPPEMDEIQVGGDDYSPDVTYCDIRQHVSHYPGDGNINDDPLFADPDSGDFHLGNNSPCIDAGNCGESSIVASDFEGDPRRIDVPWVADTGSCGGDPAVDIGADEYTPPFVNLTVGGRVGYLAGSCEVVITAAVENEGNLDVGQPVGVHFSYSAEKGPNPKWYSIQDSILDPLPAKGSAEVVAEWIPPKKSVGATFTLKIAVDPVTQPQEENNPDDNEWQDEVIPGNPVVGSISAEWDGLPGDAIGVFPEGVSIPNKFTAVVSSPNPEANPVTRVEFELDGRTVQDTDPAGGWSATFDMGTLDAGVYLGWGSRTLTVRAYDDENRASPDKEVKIYVLALPAWLEKALGVGIPINFGWISGKAQWNAAQKCAHFEIAISPKDPNSGEEKKGEEHEVPDGFGFDGKLKFDYPKFKIWLDVYLHGRVAMGGSAEFNMDFGKYVKFGLRGGLAAEIKTSTLELVKLVASLGATAGVNVPLDRLKAELSSKMPTFKVLEWPIEGSVDSEIELAPNGNDTLEVTKWTATGAIKTAPMFQGSLDLRSHCLELILLAGFIQHPRVGGNIGVAVEVSATVQYQKGDPAPRFVSAKVDVCPSVKLWGCPMWFELVCYPVKTYDIFPMCLDCHLTAGNLNCAIGPKPSAAATLDPAPLCVTCERTAQLLAASPPPPDVAGAAVFSDDYPDVDPAVASDGSGNATAVWVHADQDPENPVADIYSSTWDGANWTAPQAIVVDDSTDVGPSVAYVAGVPLAVWATSTGDWGSEEWTTGFEIVSSTQSGGAWTAPVALTDNAAFDGMPSLASSGSGAMAVWVSDGDGNLTTIDDNQMYYSEYAGSWSAPQPMAGGSVLGAPHAAASGDQAIAAWVRDADGNESTVDNQDVYCALWDGSEWGTPQAVASDPGVGYHAPYVAYSPDGEPVAVWVEDSASGAEVRFSTLSGGSWSAPQTVSDTETTAASPSVAFDSGNNTVVVWNALAIEEELVVSHLRRAVRDASDASWSPPGNLTEGLLFDWQPGVAMLDDEAMVVYLRHHFVYVEDGEGTFTVDDDDVYYLLHRIAPDLEVAGDEIAFSTETPALGEAVQVDAVIRNSGGLDSGPTIARFYDGDPEDSGTQIGSDFSLDTMQPGGNTTLTAYWTATPGTHEIHVTVDPEDTLLEVDEDNNVASRTIRLLPDLGVEVEDISFSDDDPLECDTVTIQAAIHNSGGLTSSGTNVRMYDGDPDDGGALLGEQPLGPVAPGGTATASVPWADVTVGSYSIYVVVDEDGAVEEYSEDNNTTQKPIVVSAGVDLEVGPADIAFRDENPVPGGEQWIEATVHNTGDRDAEELVVSFFDGDPDSAGTAIGEVRIAAILQGGNYTAHLEPGVGGSAVTLHDWSWMSQPGSHDIHVRTELVDPADEGNTTNNAASRTITVGHPPEADAGGPYTGSEGSPVRFVGNGTDLDGDLLLYRWDFDSDGVWDTGWADNGNASCTWGDDWSGTATLQVYDGYFTDEDTAAVTVENAAPSALIESVDQPNPHFILPRVHTLTFNGNFTDPGWPDTHATLWEFGDGDSTAGTMVEENVAPDATGNSTASHVYARPGDYLVTFTVTDDDGGSGDDTVTVHVASGEEALEILNSYIQGLPDEAFDGKAEQTKNALANKCSALASMLDTGNSNGAAQKLESDLRSKADGLVDGRPNDDWVVDPEAQQAICDMIDDLVAYL